MYAFHIPEDVNTLIQALATDFRQQYKYIREYASNPNNSISIAVQNDAVEVVARALAVRVVPLNKYPTAQQRQREISLVFEEFSWLFGHTDAHKPCTRLQNCGLFHKAHESCIHNCIGFSIQ